MNPYAAHLGSHDAVETVTKTPQVMAALVAAMGEKRLNEPREPGKWSPREIVAHLADCEVVFSFRLRQALAEDNPTVQPFDQDKWAAVYGAYDAKAALALFTALRQWNVALLRSLTPDAFDRKLTHPERGEMTFRTIVETMGGHDLNHLAQLQRVAGAK